MELTTEDRNVLAHVVIDPDAWGAHAVKEFGEDKARGFLDAKVARWKPDYEAKKGLPGYKTRAEREAA